MTAKTDTVTEKATSQQTADTRGSGPQLALATGAFACCFAIFGSASAMMPLIRDRLELSAVQVSMALAVPVLLGSLGRIPLGIWTDRSGGRLVFSAVMAASRPSRPRRAIRRAPSPCSMSAVDRFLAASLDPGYGRTLRAGGADPVFPEVLPRRIREGRVPRREEIRFSARTGGPGRRTP